MPELPTASNKLDSIQIGTNAGGGLGGDDDVFIAGGKWEDGEERRFFEDVQDLREGVYSGKLSCDIFGNFNLQLLVLFKYLFDNLVCGIPIHSWARFNRCWDYVRWNCTP